MQFAGMMSKSNIVPKDYQGTRQRLGGGAVGHGTEPAAARRCRTSPSSAAALDLGRRDARHRARSGLLSRSGEDIRRDRRGLHPQAPRRDAVSREFTVEDAKRAGLLGKQGPWQHTPSA